MNYIVTTKSNPEAESPEEAIEKVAAQARAECEACGEEFIPGEGGLVETEHEPTYSYCFECCHW